MLIPTVTGMIDSADLGYTLMHEHAVTCSDWSLRMCLKNRFCNENRLLEMAVTQLKKAKDAGIQTIVDGTPINLGRDIRLIRNAAEQTGMNIIVSSGFYHQQDPWLDYKPGEEIVDYLDYECTNGLEELPVRPGIMKAAIDIPGITPYIQKMLSATAKVAVKHQIPVFCHTIPELKQGFGLLDIMAEQGVPVQAVIVGHSGDVDDIDYLEGLLERGCYLGMDRFGIVTKTPGTALEARCKTVARLCQDGFTEQLVVSHDYVPYSGFVPDWPVASREEELKKPVNFTYFEYYAVPILRELGVSEKDLRKLKEENPRRFFENAFA